MPYISKRTTKTKTGWAKVFNKHKDTCDKCLNKLWIAPSGQVYCDKEKCGDK